MGKSIVLITDDKEDIARLLQLAGVGQQPPVSSEIETDPNGAFEVEVDDDGSISLPTNEVADYDFGNNPTSRKGYVYPSDPYAIPGDAEDFTHAVSARSADNPLRRLGETKGFGEYLKEVEAMVRPALTPRRR